MIDFQTNPAFYVSLSIIIFLFCVSTLIIGGISILTLSVNAKTVNVWKDFSEKHGFTFGTPTKPSEGWQGQIRGSLEGRQFRISSHNIGRRSPVISKIETPVNNLKDYYFSIGTKGIFGNFYRTNTGQSFTVGKGFDDRFSAQSNSPETANSFLFSKLDL